jgi:hypothetical protein
VEADTAIGLYPINFIDGVKTDDIDKVSPDLVKEKSLPGLWGLVW